MNVVVIGLGSMGRRRIRLMKTLNSELEIRGVDLSSERQKQAKEELGIESYSELKEAIMDFRPDCAFICTSPISHGAIALECLNSGLNIFTEINLLSDWYKKAMEISRKNGAKIFLSSTFLYRKEIQYIEHFVNNEVVNYIYHTGQYLPDWHPWESYKNFFVSNPKTNGCREIFGIELPWIVKVFGEIVNFNVLKSKISNLELNYNDNYMVMFEHKNGTKGVMCVDVVSRKAVRNLEIYSENKHLFWDGSPSGLKKYNFETKTLDNIELYENIVKDSKYSSSIIENAYSDEIREFFEVINGEKSTSCHSLENDKNILELIDRIEGVNDRGINE